MESDKKNHTDKVEAEMKLLIEKLNNENAALNKILSSVGEPKDRKAKGEPEDKKAKGPDRKPSVKKS